MRCHDLSLALQAQLLDPDLADLNIGQLADIETAGPNGLIFLHNKDFLNQVQLSGAGACLVASDLADNPALKGKARLLCPSPLLYAIKAIELLSPTQPDIFDDPAAPVSISPLAYIEPDVTLAPFVVIGPDVSIGRGTTIAPPVIIGQGVTIGRQCTIGAGTIIAHAHIGDRVKLHSGIQIGNDGFDYRWHQKQHHKLPHRGRVIIQDDVEIGANTTIDRGFLKDTLIGQGTKIDNLVQIAHNVSIGQHCLITALSGVGGSAKLAERVAIGGKVGIKDHVSIGAGTQIAASSDVAFNVPAGVRWGGTPARPLRQLFREIATLEQLAQGSQKKGITHE